ncbi:MAG: amino acid permease [Planctomycetaceae bacterium]|nr:amino acid permease [Planctomycetaceae bacterium]
MVQHSQKKFGAFLGVFTPSLLTILGVIMYLRFGWVVASVGVGGALLIVVICSAVAFITALSAAAVATNTPLGTGGEYYLISRSLGLPIGGAIGIPLYLCRVLSVTLYCFGLAEALAMIWPASWGAPPLPYLAVAFIFLTTVISGKSAEVSLKLQIPLMALVGLSIVALATGSLSGPIRKSEVFASPEAIAAAGGFWGVLAVYFPAITGFNAGIGMSGDLKDPQRAIPKGILGALAVGTLVYLIVPVLLGISEKATLQQLADIRPESRSVWTYVAVGGALLVLPGMWAAILSSAFGSILAGARVLQALARDGLSPRVLARTSRSGQPTWATWVSGAIAIAAAALGNLNTVALVVTIFFLTLYMSINLVAATEKLVNDPSYRPTIRVPWALSLLGAAGNLALMFLISPSGCVIAIVASFLVWAYLRQRALEGRWGDAWAGVWGSLARLSLRKLAKRPSDPRSWRPNILLLANGIEQRAALARMVAWFNQNAGILTVCELLTGKVEENEPLAHTRRASISQFLQCEGISAFAEAHVVSDFEQGVIDVAQSSGVGGLRANTVAFGWPSQPRRLEALAANIRTLHHLGKSTLIIRPSPVGGPSQFERIDIWWGGKENCGDLMLLLAYLLTLNPLWRRAKITLRTIIAAGQSQEQMAHELAALIASVRINAVYEVIVQEKSQSVFEVIHSRSAGADVVFLGLMVPQIGQEVEYCRRLEEMVDGMPTTVLVRNSGLFSGRLL